MSSNFLNEDVCTLEVDYFLKKSLSKNREIPAGSILQIQQISNLSVPKQDGQQNYEAERHVLKLVLTDGDITIFALVIEPLQRINMNTPPGAKIKIVNAAPVNGQIFLLTKNNHLFLGGDVPKLIEKWNFQRKMDIKQDWGATGNVSGSEGPPMWQPFGQKSTKLDIVSLRKAKAMDIVNEKKEDAAKEGDASQTQFDLQRNEAISELMEKSVKQKFQKPNKHLLDKDIVVIMEEGFSIEEATEALKRFKHPQKALKFLKGRNKELPTEDKGSAIEERKERKKRNPKDQDEDEDNTPIPKEYQRPTRNISLFGFIAEHIKSDDNATESTVSNDKRADDLSDSFENMDFRDRNSRGRGGFRGRGTNQRFRGSDGNGIRRGGYARADSDTERFESYSNFPPTDRSSGFRGSGYQESGSDQGRQEYNRGRVSQEPERNLGHMNRDRERPEYARAQGREDDIRGPERYEQSRDEGRKDYNRCQERQDSSHDSGRQEYARDLGRPEYNRGAGRKDYSREQGQQEYNRNQGRQEYNRDSGRQDQMRDQRRPDYIRGGTRQDCGRQNYSRDLGQQDYNRDQGRQNYNREHGEHDYKREKGYQDYDRERGPNDFRQMNQQRDNYPSLSQISSSIETDSQKGYSQAPRFQKQQYSSSSETTSMPYSNSGFRGHRGTNQLPSSQSFPQPDNYQHPSRDYEYNSGPRSQANGVRIAPPEREQNQYGSSEGWSPNQTMVFTRSKPGGGGGRSRGGGRGLPSSARY